MTRLEYEMTRLGMKNKVLAEFLGKTEQSIGNYRERKSEPSYSDSVKIADFMRLPLETIFDEVDAQGNLIEQPVNA
jgi:DNA-binding XRE family transcriptional regulator